MSLGYSDIKANCFYEKPVENNFFTNFLDIDFSYGVDVSYIYSYNSYNDVYVTPYMSLRRSFGFLVLDTEISMPTELDSLSPLWKLAFSIFYFPSGE